MRNSPQMVGAPPGPASADRHLAVELEWLRVVLNVHARRMQREGLLPTEQSPEPDAALGPARAALDVFKPRGGLSDDELQALEMAETYRSEVGAELARTGPLPLDLLASRCGLDADDYLLLLLGLASEFGGDFPRVFAFLNQNTNKPLPTLAMVMDCLMEPSAWVRLRRRLDPAAPLLRLRLLDWRDNGEPGWTHRPLVAALRVQRWVTGEVALDRDLEGLARLIPVGEAARFLLVSRADAAAFQRLERFFAVAIEAPRPFGAQGCPLVVVRGPDGTGRQMWVNAAATDLGLATLAVDLPALTRVVARQQVGNLAQAVETALAVALREALLQQAIVCIEGWEELASPARASNAEDAETVAAIDPARAMSAALERALAAHPHPVALLVEPTCSSLPELRRGLEVVELAMPDREVATELWRRHFTIYERASTLSPTQLADHYSLAPGQIVRVANDTRRRALVRGEAADGLLPEAVRESIRHRLGEQARWVRPMHGRDELVVDEAVHMQLDEFVSRYQHHRTVVEDWGFGARFGATLGLSALLEGPPGTGKTMTAGILASELGLDCFQIDLSRVVSKYIGETEKHLGRLFDEAERARVMLLFDEADSLFAKRTEVKSSNDRYSNLEVNYLLQRLESFSGVCLLTTNAGDNVDPAFARRLTMRIRVESPNADLREKLWRTMLADRVKVSNDIDPRALADEFEMAGGLIRNTVLRAAFMAAARNVMITHGLVRAAARVELRQHGRLVSGSPMADLQAAFGGTGRERVPGTEVV